MIISTVQHPSELYNTMGTFLLTQLSRFKTHFNEGGPFNPALQFPGEMCNSISSCG